MGTLGFMLILLTIIVVVIDVQSKTPRIEENGYTAGYFLVHFYPYWMLYLLITFMSILVFISVIFFTSRIANNTEIVAYISSGASFHRFAKPYLITSLILVVGTLTINHFILPWANKKKNDLIIYTYNSGARDKYTANTTIASQLSPTEYIFINSYNRQNNRGSGYMYQKFDKDRKLIYQILASEVTWDEKEKKFMLTSYTERTAGKNDTEILGSGDKKMQDFKMHPDELFPNDLQAENKTTPELVKFINRERDKGNGNLNAYLNELHQRTSMPISIFILTFLALSLSSQKKRGGLGLNLALGIGLAFAFIFSFEMLKVVSSNRAMDPLLGMWLPNLVFGPLAIYLYIKRANQ